jgi:hypothetical protein
MKRVGEEEEFLAPKRDAALWYLLINFLSKTVCVTSGWKEPIWLKGILFISLSQTFSLQGPKLAITTHRSPKFSWKYLNLVPSRCPQISSFWPHKSRREKVGKSHQNVRFQVRKVLRKYFDTKRTQRQIDRRCSSMGAQIRRGTSEWKRKSLTPPPAGAMSLRLLPSSSPAAVAEMTTIAEGGESNGADSSSSPIRASNGNGSASRGEKKEKTQAI